MNDVEICVAWKQMRGYLFSLKCRKFLFMQFSVVIKHNYPLEIYLFSNACSCAQAQILFCAHSSDSWWWQQSPEKIRTHYKSILVQWICTSLFVEHHFPAASISALCQRVPVTFRNWLIRPILTCERVLSPILVLTLAPNFSDWYK